VDLGRSVCVRTYGLILKQNWRLHWGTIPFSWWLFVFFCGHLLWFHFSPVLSVSESSGYPDRPSESRSFLQFYFIFQIFGYVQEFSHCTPLQPARTGQVRTLLIGFSARFSHLAQRLPARIIDSRTVLYCLPANSLFQNFEIEFWSF
jgi:hypothetical protein